MSLFPILPLIFIAAYIFIAVSITLEYARNDYASLKGIIVLTAFTGLYFLLTRLKKNKQEIAA